MFEASLAQDGRKRHYRHDNQIQYCREVAISSYSRNLTFYLLYYLFVI